MEGAATCDTSVTTTCDTNSVFSVSDTSGTTSAKDIVILVLVETLVSPTGKTELVLQVLVTLSGKTGLVAQDVRLALKI